jgi:hypothetical protein
VRNWFQTFAFKWVNLYRYAGEDYNLFGNNCHQFSAHAMNLMAYDGRRDWNMIHLAAFVLLKGKWVDTWWGCTS